MRKVFALLFILSLAISDALSKDASPRDLFDDAEAKLARIIVQIENKIRSAHIRLQAISSDFLANSQSILDDFLVELSTETARINGEILDLKDLATSLGVDPTTCASSREELLQTLPDDYTNHVGDCLETINSEQKGIIDDETYNIDVYYMRVTILQYQFQLCNRDYNCIEPIMSQIDMLMKYMMDVIDTKILSVNGKLNLLKVNGKTCSGNNLAEYVSESDFIVKQIEDCINNLILQ